MRVLHLLGETSFGGTEIHVLRLARQLSVLGCDVAVACRAGAARLRAEARAAQIDAIGLGRAAAFGETSVVHAHDGISALVGAVVAARSRAAFVRTQHFVRPASAERSGPGRTASLALHRALNRRLDGYIVVSSAAAAAARTRRDAVRARSAVIGSGAALAEREQVEQAGRSRAAAAEPVIVSAGRLWPERRFDVLVDALPAILARHPGCRVVIAGAGPAGPALRAQADRHGVGAAIEWTGWLEDVAPVLASGHVYVNTWPWEGFGMAMAEAMGYGLPVVAADSGAAPELVLDRLTGRLVAPENPAALADAVNELLANRAAAAAMGAAGRGRALARYSISATAEATLAFYRELLEHRLEGTSRFGS